MNRGQCVYLFTCWWTSGLFPHLGKVNNAVVNVGVQVTVQVLAPLLCKYGISIDSAFIRVSPQKTLIKIRFSDNIHLICPTGKALPTAELGLLPVWNLLPEKKRNPSWGWLVCCSGGESSEDSLLLQAMKTRPTGPLIPSRPRPGCTPQSSMCKLPTAFKSFILGSEPINLWRDPRPILFVWKGTSSFSER